MEEPKDMFKGKNVDINILKLVDIIDYCQCVCLPFVVCLLFVLYVCLLLYRYYKVNDVRRFRSDRPFHKGTKDPQHEFAVRHTH